jgi:hypothetical protein
MQDVTMLLFQISVLESSIVLIASRYSFGLRFVGGVVHRYRPTFRAILASVEGGASRTLTSSTHFLTQFNSDTPSPTTPSHFSPTFHTWRLVARGSSNASYPFHNSIHRYNIMPSGTCTHFHS